MVVEIERKFLVVSDDWRAQARISRHIVDHVIARFETGKARIRICDGVPLLTFKGLRKGVSRSEYHLNLDLADAADLVAEFGAPPLEKRRHEVEVDGLTWQVDEHLGGLAGLVTADVELPHERHSVSRPTWAGPDITHDRRYSSSALSLLLQGDEGGLDALLPK